MSKLFLPIVIIGLLSHVEVDLPKVEDYEKKLEELRHWSKNITVDKFYENNFSFKDNKTDKEKKFVDLPVFDRRMFKLITTQNFNKHLEKIEGLWAEELKQAAGKPVSKSKKDAVAGPDDIAKFVEELKKIRKETVAGWEKQANSLFKDYPKEFDEKEQNNYLKTIKTIKENLEKK